MVLLHGYSLKHKKARTKDDFYFSWVPTAMVKSFADALSPPLPPLSSLSQLQKTKQSILSENNVINSRINTEYVSQY